MINDQCIVIIDGYDYKDGWGWNDDQTDQMLLGLTKCGVIILRHGQLLGKYDTFNSDGHIFGRTLSRKEMKPLWNCARFGEYHKYEI